METLLVLQIGFDKSHMLRPDRFAKELKKSKNVLKWLFGLMKRKSNESKSKKSSQNENTPLIQTSSAIEDPITNNVEVQPLLYLNESEGDTNMLEIRNLCKSTDGWDKKEKDTLVGHEENMDSRNLFEHFSFNVKSNGMSSVTGPSGSGKSQLLQCIASLTPIQEGEVLLNGKRWDIESRVEWRRKVRYVTQFKVDIPGKPIDFINRITSFKSWIKDPSAPKLEDVVETTQTLISKWGLSVDCLDKDWSILSGGESQRVILAIAFASKPEVMMLDESTSALDQKSKEAVEASIKEYTQKFGWKVLLVSHDGEQFERMKDLIV
jgi:ABC-type glutathione transport system ATPase component